MLIKTLIRKKRLELAQDQQMLGQLRTRERQQKDIVELHNARIQQELQRWNTHMSETSELSVQQLTMTRNYVGRIEQSRDTIIEEMKAQNHIILQLEGRSGRMHKEIEKLEEIACERAQLQEQQKLQQEWQSLDQWAINRKGGRP